MVAGHGGRLEKIWRETSPTDTNEQRLGFISWVKVCETHEYTSKALNDPYTGLKLAYDHSEDFHSFGPMVFILKRSKNIREFLRVGLKYQRVHTNGFSVETVEDEEAQELRVYFTFHPVSGPHRQCLEHLFGLISMFHQKMIKGDYITRIAFQHRPPDDMTWHETLFPGVAIEFNAPRNMMVADLSLLGADRTSYITRALEKAVNLHLKRQLKRHPYAQQSISASVSEILPALITVNKSDIESAASILGLHAKKLQRLLKDEGTSYRDVLDQVRKAVATRLLQDTDISVSNLARMLDYSSDRPFNAAFQRWFDMAPTQYRKMSEVSGEGG